ncbi:MAG: VWA domain-containing protein [Clostridia bacterium]|nr:VWA domain-containing protein [Clostridia bacterium]
MRKNLTELVMILDRSGSMAGLESDTIGGYNSMLRKQRAAEGEVLVSTVLFDNVSELLYDRVPLADLPLMTEKEYYVRGCTALLDAVGAAIQHIGNVHKYAREEDRPEKTIFVITTDGMENASRSYTYAQVKKLVERQKEQYGWEFLFLGANIDAIETAGRFGITPDRAANYKNDHEGTLLNYQVLAETVCEMRACAAPIDGHWKRRIEEDYDRRGKIGGG